ncbi:MAG TPA: ABC transporter permease [Kofleriaceae bacterium]|nr:ABC transporter permease [Kofleriaceae bacterium]
MSLWTHLGYLVRRLDRRRAERDLDDELRAHLDLEIEGNVAAGMSMEEAIRAARRKLGSIAIAREDARAVWQLPLLEAVWRDLRHAARVLRARPAYATAAVVSLALGIGVCTAVFSAVDAVVLRPLPYPGADRIVELREVAGDGHRMRVAEANYQDVRARTGVFDSVAEYAVAVETVTGGTWPVRAVVVSATRDLFRVFRIHPIVGRTLLPEESTAAAPPVALVSHDFWRRALGARPELGGVRVEGESYAVVGVMPPGFDFPGRGDVWVARERLGGGGARTAHNWSVVGRLRDGVSLEQARADVSAVAVRLKKELGEGTDAADMALIRLQDQIVGDAGRALWILLGAVGLLLLIAVANVANLMLAQAAARQKEIALRAALGATRPRLVRQFVTEALLLALLGAGLGVLLAVAGVDLLLGLDRAALPRAGEISIDLRALAFTAGLSIAVAVALGLVTALRGSGVDLRASVAEAGGQRTAGAARARLRKGLVVAQVALAFTLLTGAGLLARSFAGLIAVDPGFRGAGAVAIDLSVTATTTLTKTDPAAQERVRRLYVELMGRIRELPGVTAVGAANALPLGGDGANGTFLIDDDRSRTGDAEYRVASPGYFQTMQIPLLRGRLFGPGDIASAPHVAVVSQSMARAIWPDGDAIGQRIQFGNMDGDSRLLNVVGIVGDVRDSGLDAAFRPTVYASTMQRPPPPTLSVVVRARADPLGLIPELRAVLQRLDPELPAEIRTLEQIAASTLDGRRFSLVLLAVFAVVAFVLALTGIYGVTAYSVGQRTREIGIRVALGARPRAVLGMVVGEGAVMALGGVAVGAAAALALARLIASWLYGVGPGDPITFVVVGLALAGAAVAACWVPARRAVRVDPIVALRAD